MLLDQEVLNRLVVAQSFLSAAWASGSPQHSISDGYQALDNALTALQTQRGYKPTFRHLDKINDAFEHCAALFSSNGIEREGILAFHKLWLGVRYSPVKCTPHEAIQFLRLSSRVMNVVLSDVADSAEITVDELTDEIHSLLFGSPGTLVDNEISDIFDMYAWQAEAEGERLGAKRGMKLSNTANFANVLVLGSDSATQELIANDETLATRIGKLYIAFLEIINFVQIQRHFQLEVPMEEVMNFSLAIRLGYSGTSFADLAADWAAERKLMEELIREQSSSADSNVTNIERC